MPSDTFSQLLRSKPKGDLNEGSLQANHRAKLIAILGSLAMLPRPAAAYMEPSSISFFLQIVVGVVAALWVLIILYWPRLRKLLGIGTSDADPSERDSESD